MPVFDLQALSRQQVRVVLLLCVILKNKRKNSHLWIHILNLNFWTMLILNKAYFESKPSFRPTLKMH